VLKIAQQLLTVSPRLFSIWLVLQLAIQDVLGGEEAPESAIIYWRFLPDGRQAGSSWAIEALYADRAKPHKHWRFCISLIWQVGT
jgi:hypothetical protein